MLFQDRVDAGQRLAGALDRYRGDSPVVVGLPRGGVVVAYEIARALGAQLDLWAVRKIGLPGQEELGLGAVAEGGEVYINDELAKGAGLSADEIDELVDSKIAQVEARARRLRGGRAPVELTGRTVIVVDDGIATGGTVRAALRAIRRRRPARLILAAPVAAASTLASLRPEADEAVCLEEDPELTAIGAYYDDFSQTSSELVIELLERASGRAPP